VAGIAPGTFAITLKKKFWMKDLKSKLSYNIR
jgi:hypothetical protein